ncbi:MAG: hypothetical protein V1888_02730 [archaeon]
MKYKIIFLLVLFFISSYLLPITSAIPTLQFQHEQTQPGETILATILTTEEFVKQIEPSDITFYEGRKQITLDSNIIFYQGQYYLYIYTTREGNFSVKIENILYKEDNILKSTTISKEFNVSKNILTDEETNETFTQILSIKPGFIFTTQTPSIKLINSGTATLNLTYNEKEISLTPSQSQSITFIPTEVFTTLSISTYKEFQVPIIYLTTNQTNQTTNQTNQTNQTNETIDILISEADLRQNPELLLVETFTDTKSEEIIELLNLGDNNITNLETASSLEFIKTQDLEDMPPRGIQNLTLIINPKNPGHFQGTINITFTQNEEQKNIQILLSIFVLPKEAIGTNQTFEVKEETCQEISGQVCTSGLFCNGTTTFTKNSEYCCLASCVETKSESNGFGWILGMVILIILALIGYYFYKKQKQVTPQNTQQQLRAKTEQYNKRLIGALTKS